ncbi:MAG: hypothetical protein KBH06_01105 [Spirochaetes bacterium]|nr:hypothetical protein [Spirochaetota bacterium]
MVKNIVVLIIFIVPAVLFANNINDDLDHYLTKIVICVDDDFPNKYADEIEKYIKNDIRKIRNLEYNGRTNVKELDSIDKIKIKTFFSGRVPEKGRVLILRLVYKEFISRSVEKMDGELQGDYLIRKDYLQKITIESYLVNIHDSRDLLNFKKEIENDSFKFSSALSELKEKIALLYPDIAEAEEKKYFLNHGVTAGFAKSFGEYTKISNFLIGFDYNASFKYLWSKPIYPVFSAGIYYAFSDNPRIKHCFSMPVIFGAGYDFLSHNKMSLSVEILLGYYLHCVKAEDTRLYFDPIIVFRPVFNYSISDNLSLRSSVSFSQFFERSAYGRVIKVSAGLERKVEL